MNKLSLDAMAREQGRRAAAAPSGRAAETVYGGHERFVPPRVQWRLGTDATTVAAAVLCR